MRGKTSLKQEDTDSLLREQVCWEVHRSLNMDDEVEKYF